jgi:hypothetical protein
VGAPSKDFGTIKEALNRIHSTVSSDFRFYLALLIDNFTGTAVITKKRPKAKTTDQDCRKEKAAGLRRICSDMPDYNSHAGILARRKIKSFAFGIDVLGEFSIATDP